MMMPTTTPIENRMVDVSAIPVDQIEHAYDSQGLADVSDAELVDAVVATVSVPRLDAQNSFVLHAPLELMARARLLPHIAPEARRRARLHLLAIAAQYEASGEGVGASEPGSDGPIADAATLGDLLAAVDRGDLVATDGAARALGNTPQLADAMVDQLADAVAPRTAAAAHAPIYLGFLADTGADAARFTPLLRPLARALARTPEQRVHWIDDHRWDGPPADAGQWMRRLATTSSLGVPGSSFIHPLVAQVDRTGVAADVVGPLVGTTTPHGVHEARIAIQRVAALSMVSDDPHRAPYGWTHCFTLPAAILSITGRAEDPSTMIAIAGTQVVAFRAAFGTVDPLADTSLLRPLTADEQHRTTAMLTEAAVRHDAHIVKYADAMRTAMLHDREAGALYLAAGEHLLSVWDDLGGDPTDPLA